MNTKETPLIRRGQKRLVPTADDSPATTSPGLARLLTAAALALALVLAMLVSASQPASAQQTYPAPNVLCATLTPPASTSVSPQYLSADTTCTVHGNLDPGTDVFLAVGNSVYGFTASGGPESFGPVGSGSATEAHLTFTINGQFFNVTVPIIRNIVITPTPTPIPTVTHITPTPTPTPDYGFEDGIPDQPKLAISGGSHLHAAIAAVGTIMLGGGISLHARRRNPGES